MTQPSWPIIDTYLSHLLTPEDPILTATLAANAAAHLPPHDISPLQGKFLHILARSIAATRILEIGTLGAYSTIWLARALAPAGKLITLESNPAHAAIAHSNLTRANLTHLVDLRLAPALDSLEKLQSENLPPFDLIFIDADKPNNPHYLAHALRLSRPGTLIIADNVIRNGTVADPHTTDPNAQGIRHFLNLIAQDPRLTATALQTVGSKGHDGFALALVNNI